MEERKVLENSFKTSIERKSVNLDENKEEVPEKEPMTVSDAVKTTAPETKAQMYPTNIVQLPSKGLFYPSDSPLSSGTIEIRYMTTKEEDILTTDNYALSGVIIDKLLQSLIVSPINYDDLLIGDKNAIMVAARIYGYGEEYKTKVTTPSGKEQDVVVNLSELPHKKFNEDEITRGQNSFKFQLPIDKNVVEFQLITVGLQRKIDDRLKKIRLSVKKGGSDKQISTRLSYMIKSIDNNDDPNYIRLFVEGMKSLDSIALRRYIISVQPDIEMSVEEVDQETFEPFRGDFAIGADFFWPNAGVSEAGI